MNDKIEKILDELEETLSGKSVVMELVGKYEVSDYDRGRIYGQIQMLIRIRRELEDNDNNKKL